ncbi:uncharacterized protein LOC110859464 [Folsomia candida]|uniref:Ferredoxin-like protein in nif region n=1 Tax=Folsomia candida TaxID=158441 RepID=A0A226DBN6_FOLCA|nr:uncharacterized protein LOC110859464 [Folsomia candida]OXA42254.1 Ferredoxin-like protein in nif region [Folsomia candida]
MAPSAIDKVERDRDTVKVNLTWLEKRFNDHVTAPAPEAKIRHYIKTVERAQEKIEDLFQKIASIVDPKDMDPHSAEYMSMKDRALELEHQFATVLKTFAVPVIPTAASPSTPSTLQLPKLTLPTFDGDLNEWIAFRDMFTNAVHNNASLSKSQKLTYLKAQLKGEAARQVQSITISDANYDIAWTQLSDRYQNDREIFFSIMKRFHDQPLVQPHSAHGIRQLLDVSRECIRSLDVLKLSTHHWGAHLMFIIARKMDYASKELWEQSLKDSAIPSLQTLYDFLEQRARALSASSTNAQKSSKQATHRHDNEKTSRPNGQPSRNLAHLVQSPPCKVCSENHPVFKCPTLNAMSVQERSEAVKKASLCFNCLKDNHTSAQCPSSKTCRTCNGKHHTLLHRGRNPDASRSQETSSHMVHLARSGTATATAKPDKQHNGSNGQVFATTCQDMKTKNLETLLATARVLVPDRYSKLQPIRILSDSGSNTHYITESCIKKLGLPRTRCVASATGLGEGALTVAKGFTWLTVSPHFNPSISMKVKALIIPKITGDLPLNPISQHQWPHLQNLKLADPSWHQPLPVDMLLGAEFFFEVTKDGKKTGPPGSPVALNSSFGWMIGGGCPDYNNSLLRNVSHLSTTDHMTEEQSLDQAMRKFWEIEEVPPHRTLTKEEEACEEHFTSTVKQTSNGQLMVHIPYKLPCPVLGSSLEIAIRRLKQIERRLAMQPHYKDEYAKFMKEYLDLGHMTEVGPPDKDDTNHCYIPHHFVLKADSTTTKFRIVFDASSKTSNGVSLNDTMLIGPTIQDNLFDLILRFRLHKIAFTADVEKMYRQVLVRPEDANLQRIVWRENSNEPIKHFILRTVTYGTAAASFQATRALQEVGQLKKEELPKAAAVICRDFYMDDLISGDANEEDALITQSQLLEAMESGGFKLRKWSSNCETLLNALPEDLPESKSTLPLDVDPTIKTLGICWNPKEDVFVFKIQPPAHDDTPLTKRKVLSELAKIFDPPGWLSPVIINAKLLMQSLHTLQVGWDTTLPESIQQQWISLVRDMSTLARLQLPRHYLHDSTIASPTLDVPVVTNMSGLCGQSSQLNPAISSTMLGVSVVDTDSSKQRHGHTLQSSTPHHPTQSNNSSLPAYCLAGFSDASERAYSAVVYFCAYQEDKISTSLITSKTRVAPVKTVSLPRLELCGALLLSELMSSVQSALRIPLHSVTAWTDSSVTLSWIKSHPSRWKTFVANRLTKIQALVPPERWGHVRSEDNPADCASRGISSSKLINHSLWWKGPHWLKHGIPIPHGVIGPHDDQCKNEERNQTICHAEISSPNQVLLNKY